MASISSMLALIVFISVLRAKIVSLADGAGWSSGCADAVETSVKTNRAQPCKTHSVIPSAIRARHFLSADIGSVNLTACHDGNLFQRAAAKRLIAQRTELDNHLISGFDCIA